MCRGMAALSVLYGPNLLQQQPGTRKKKNEKGRCKDRIKKFLFRRKEREREREKHPAAPQRSFLSKDFGQV